METEKEMNVLAIIFASSVSAAIPSPSVTLDVNNEQVIKDAIELTLEETYRAQKETLRISVQKIETPKLVPTTNQVAGRVVQARD